MVLAAVLELLFLLCDPAVDLLADLAKLQRGTEHLVLLLLEGTLGLLKSSLQLLLLDLEPPPLLVQLVDGAATIAKLVEQVLDLIGEVLVLALDHIELLHGLVIAGLQTEHLRGVVPALTPARLQLGHEVVSLGLPLTHHLVKVLAPLLGDDGSGVGALVLHLEILELNIDAVLGLLSGSDLSVERVNGLLGLVHPGAKLGLVALQLVNAAESLGFELGLPQLDLSLGLGEGAQRVVLALRLLLDPHLHVLTVGGQVLVLGQQRSTVTRLSIGEPLGVLQLCGQRHLALAKSGNGVLGLLDLAGKILRLDNQLLLGAVRLVQGTSQLIHLLVGLHDGALGHLAVLLDVGALPHGVVKTSAGLAQISLHVGLVLLGLGLVLIESIDLLAHLRHGVVVLLTECSQGALVGDVGLLQIALELLVQLDLGAGVGASLLKTTAEVLDVAGQSSSVLLGLGPVLPLNVQLLVQLLDPGLQLLDLLAILGTESSFVFNLGRHGHQLLLPPLQSSTKISLDPVKVANSLLSQLEVALDLPLELLHVTLGLFLPLESILSLVERLLKLSLDLAQVVAPVLHGLDVLLGLLPALAGTLLLLLQLGDQLLLVSNLLPQGVDLVVLGALVLLALLAGGLQSLDGVP